MDRPRLDADVQNIHDDSDIRLYFYHNVRRWNLFDQSAQVKRQETGTAKEKSATKFVS